MTGLDQSLNGIFSLQYTEIDKIPDMFLNKKKRYQVYYCGLDHPASLLLMALAHHKTPKTDNIQENFAKLSPCGRTMLHFSACMS